MDTPEIVWNQKHGVYIRSGLYGSQDIDVCREVIDGKAYDFSRLPDLGSVHRIIDVGAHIGTFSVLAHREFPSAEITCVEACPENLRVLKKNCWFADVLHGACTYEDGELVLLNSIKQDGTATGGSIVTTGDEPFYGHLYWRDTRPLRRYTLDELVGDDTLDILKLDCEGSEFSILEHAECLDRVRVIMGEYHDQARWDDLLKRKFRKWSYENPHRAGGLGTFVLVQRP